ncbi:hypothetical protein PV10_04023 [Exophiala mesophila]|uniref:SCP domain-containing protein n=1 Tax=Exophiala mesophila TaxID=212818 RepID=A0A0D1ZFW3_EXOME|nr:uncharacterized protein PV10_04023 [Exophiala mesophila]KIV92754.1 hypothetical protein PV10_04023 [Exophiala mesophila]
MRSATPLVLVGLCAALASANPFDKRALVTHFEYVTITATVTGLPPTNTDAAPIDDSNTDVDGSNDWSSTWVDWNGGQGGGRSSGGGWGGGWGGNGNGNGGGNWGGIGGGGGGGGNGGTAGPSSTPDPEPTTTNNGNNPPPNTNTGRPTNTAGPTQPTNTPAPTQPTNTPAPTQPTNTQTSPTGGSNNPAPTSISSDYKQGILDSHNIHRANHTVNALVWDDRLTNIAAQIAASCVYAHDTSTGGGGYGQNIGAGSPPSDIPAMITNLMYNNEINYYPGYGTEPSMANFHLWGHFSQIVWKSTTSVGCATQYCPNGLANTGGGVSPYFTVCNYSPPGNFGGQYAANVLAPLGYPTVVL